MMQVTKDLEEARKRARDMSNKHTLARLYELLTESGIVDGYTVMCRDSLPSFSNWERVEYYDKGLKTNRTDLSNPYKGKGKNAMKQYLIYLSTSTRCGMFTMLMGSPLSQEADAVAFATTLHEKTGSELVVREQDSVSSVLLLQEVFTSLIIPSVFCDCRTYNQVTAEPGVSPPMCIAIFDKINYTYRFFCPDCCCEKWLSVYKAPKEKKLVARIEFESKEQLQAELNQMEEQYEVANAWTNTEEIPETFVVAGPVPLVDYNPGGLFPIPHVDYDPSHPNS